MKREMRSFPIVGISHFALLFGKTQVAAFGPYLPFRCSLLSYAECPFPTSRLFSGRGIAKDYNWTEQAFEIDVTVQVPRDTRAKDIQFKATPATIGLSLMNDKGESVVLLDPARKLRGKVVVDGTYWMISDLDDKSAKTRQVTVTIEKFIRTPKDDFDVVDYDWKGVYSQEEENEVTARTYDEPEVMNVREYAASLGVDIDNINMSMVDKTMFSSGLNLTQSSLEELTKAGLLKEVTKQADGSEWVVNDSGEAVPFSSLGDGVSNEELQSQEKPDYQVKRKIPFLDTDSRWHTVEKREKGIVNETLASGAVETESERKAASNRERKRKQIASLRIEQAKDPIDTLTVARLKEILRSRGLKTSGSKRELQGRLREQVQSLLKNGENETHRK